MTTKEACEYIVSKDFVVAINSVHAMRKWVREFQEVAREALEGESNDQTNR